jgi:hypothetical protein
MAIGSAGESLRRVAAQRFSGSDPSGTSVALAGGVPRHISLVSFALLALAACGFDPGDDSPMTPPAVYRQWWAKTEACSGLSGDFDRVQWSVIPGYGFKCSSGTCAGHWEPDHKIYLAQDWTTNEMVVRHEMLHDLVGHRGHPDPPFGSPCPLTWATWKGDPSPSLDTAAQDLAGF